MGGSLTPNRVTKADVGLGSVDNTSDAAKPVSIAQQTALDGKVPTTRTVNGLALSADITLNAGHVGARATGVDIPIADIDATGTPGATTFLRGDGTWAAVVGKFVGVIGDGAATSIVVTHNLNTRDFTYGARKTDSPYTNVILEIEATTVNTATVKLSTAPALNEVTLTLIG